MTPFEQGYNAFMKLAMSPPSEPDSGERYMPWYAAAGGGALGHAAASKLVPGKWKLPAQILGTMVGTGVGVHGGEALGKRVDERLDE